MTGPISVQTARHRWIARMAIALLVTGCAIGIVVPAGLGWDFSNFYNAGSRVNAGQVADLYHADRPIAGQLAPGMRFWGAPLSAALFAPLAWWSPTTALVLFKVENVAAIVLALTLLFRRYRAFVPLRTPSDWWLAAFSAMCVFFQPFWTVFRVGGQSTPTVLLLVVVALLCFMESWLWTSALLLMVAALVKPTLALMLVFLMLVSGARFAAALATLGMGLGLLSIALLGWPIHREFIDVAIEGSQFARPWYYNSSLYVPFENLRLLAFTTETAPRVAAWLLGLVWMLRLGVVAVLTAIVRQSRRHSWSVPARRHFELIMAVCFWLFVSQTVWEHYLALLFPLLAYIVAWRDRFPREARWLVAGIFVLSLGQNLVLLELIRARYELTSIAQLVGVGLFKSGPLMLTLVVLWFQRRVLYDTYSDPQWSRARPHASAGGTTA